MYCNLISSRSLRTFRKCQFVPLFEDSQDAAQLEIAFQSRGITGTCGGVGAPTLITLRPVSGVDGIRRCTERGKRDGSCDSGVHMRNSVNKCRFNSISPALRTLSFRSSIIEFVTGDSTVVPAFLRAPVLPLPSGAIVISYRTRDSR